MSEGAVRAHFAKIAIRRLRALPDGKGSEIRERMTSDIAERLRRSGDEWVPVAEMIELCDAIAESLGEAGSREFWTEVIRDTYDNGMLRPLAAQARGSQGGDAAALQLLRLAPHAWALATRDCGLIELSGDDGQLRLGSGTLLPELVRSRGIQALFLGACQSMLDQFRVRAEIAVVVDPEDPERVAYSIARR